MFKIERMRKRALSNMVAFKKWTVRRDDVLDLPGVTLNDLFGPEIEEFKKSFGKHPINSAEFTVFEDFDIDFNQYRFVVERTPHSLRRRGR